ncbi:MAG: hypothetical protein U0R19_00220 [Bryobacteraceae bacterium]
MGEKAMIAVVLVSLFTAVSYIIKNVVLAIQRSKRDRYMSEVSAKLVDKLGTAPDVMSFVESEAYKTLLGEQSTGRGPFVSRVLNSIQAGLVLLCGGMGLFAAGNFGGDPEFQVFVRATGAIVVAVGVGMVLSAGWSYLLLKKWGFLNGSGNSK